MNLRAARRRQHRRGRGRRVGDGYTVIGDTGERGGAPAVRGGPGSVTVGERTFRATSRGDRVHALEPLTLKGKAEPVPAWEAIGLIAAQPVRRAARESPLVGRDDKLGCSSRFWRGQRERGPTW